VATKGEIRRSDYIDYRTWDASKWRAWRQGEKGWFHAPDGDRNRREAHPDTILNYKTTNNSLWTATWVGNSFHHQPNGPGTPHDDKYMIYIGWADPPHMEVWKVHWDAVSDPKNPFVHECVLAT
jgi:hypothetical protein